MRIAFFSDCYLDLTGGITSSITAQKTALEKLGHEVYVFSTGYPRSIEELKKLARQNIFQVPSCRLFFYKLAPISRRPRIIEKWLMRCFPELRDFDVFYVHYEAGCSIAALKLGKQLGIPTVQVMHGREDMGETSIIPFGLRSLVAGFLNWLHSKYLPHKVEISQDNYLATSYAKAKMWTLMVNHANAADLVLTPSAHFRDKLKHYGVKREIKVMPNGFLDSKFIKEINAKELRDGEELRMIWHSRVSVEKRMMEFLKALTRVSDNYRLDVYGGGGDYFRAKRFAERYNLNVVFHGNVDFSEIQKKILHSHLDVLVSYNFDTFGNTLIEAEAAGVPVLICDPDLKETVPVGGYVLTKSPNYDDIAKAINDLIENPEKIREMSKVMLDNRDEVLISKRIKILEKIFNDIIKK